MKTGRARAFIVFGEDVVGRVFAREQAFAQGAMGQDANARAFAKAHVFGFNGAVKHVVARLIGVKRGDVIRPLHLRGVEVGHPDKARFALFSQPRHRFHAFLDGISRVPTVNLIQVDTIDTEVAEAVFNGAFDVFARILTADFCGEKAPLAIAAFECPAQCGFARAIGLGRVDQGNAAVDGRAHGVDAGVFVQVAHAAANGPRAQADDRHSRAVFAELSMVHNSSLKCGKPRCLIFGVGCPKFKVPSDIQKRDADNSKSIERFLWR